MIDQKRENLLNLALAATEVERRRVPELSAGYNSYSKTWEVIVQYQGDLAFLEEQGVRVTLLLFSVFASDFVNTTLGTVTAILAGGTVYAAMIVLLKVFGSVNKVYGRIKARLTGRTNEN